MDFLVAPNSARQRLLVHMCLLSTLCSQGETLQPLPLADVPTAAAAATFGFPPLQTVFANYAAITSKTFIVSLLVEFIGELLTSSPATSLQMYFQPQPLTLR